MGRPGFGPGVRSVFWSEIGKGVSWRRAAVAAGVSQSTGRAWVAEHVRMRTDQERGLRLSLAEQVYFCDPHSPWQRPSNESTNGLLRQYFPKGTNLSAHTAEHIANVEAEFNDRPRKRLGWKTPAEALADLLQSPPTTSSVALTP